MRPGAGTQPTQARLAVHRRNKSLHKCFWGGGREGEVKEGERHWAIKSQAERPAKEGSAAVGAARAGASHPPAIFALLAAVAEQHRAAGRIGQQRINVACHHFLK